MSECVRKVSGGVRKVSDDVRKMSDAVGKVTVGVMKVSDGVKKVSDGAMEQTLSNPIYFERKRMLCFNDVLLEFLTYKVNVILGPVKY